MSYQAVLRCLELDLTPSGFDEHGPYAVLAHARPGDHVAVRSVVKGKADVIWHHGIYVGDGCIVHMHPKNDISKVHFNDFMAAIPTSDTYIEKAGIVTYHGDGDQARAACVINAVAATVAPELQQITYDVVRHQCDGFATWCRTGRYAVLTCMPGSEVVPYVYKHPKF